LGCLKREKLVAVAFEYEIGKERRSFSDVDLVFR